MTMDAPNPDKRGEGSGSYEKQLLWGKRIGLVAVFTLILNIIFGSIMGFFLNLSSLFGGLNQSDPILIILQLSLLSAAVGIVGAILILLGEKFGRYPLVAGLSAQIPVALLFDVIGMSLIPLGITFAVISGILVTVTIKGWKAV
nr:hypothetical protein Josef01_05d18_34 [uncultured archaeon]